MGKRIAWIDVAKGILIILVILGHSHVNNILNMVINSFHMAAFFVLSGITFHTKDDFGGFLRKKVKGILVPYIFFSLLLLFYQFLKTMFWDGYDFDFFSGIVSIVIPVSGRTTTNVYGLWFLPCLFLSEIIMYWLKKLNKKSFLCAGVTAILLCIISMTASNLIKVVSVINILPIAVLFLITGNKLRNICERIERKKVFICIISLITLCITVAYNYSLSRHLVDLSSMTLGNWPLYVLSGGVGSIFICSFAMILERISLLSNIGRNSIYYYGLHYEILAVVEKLVGGGTICAIITITILYPLIFIYEKLIKEERAK